MKKLFRLLLCLLLMISTFSNGFILIKGNELINEHDKNLPDTIRFFENGENKFIKMLENWIACVTKNPLQDLGLSSIILSAFDFRVMKSVFKSGGKNALSKYILNKIPVINKAYWATMFAKNGLACVLGW